MQQPIVRGTWLVALALCACTPATGPAPVATPTVVPTPAIIPAPDVAGGNLSGWWHGSDVELPPGPGDECAIYARLILKLDQNGNSLSGRVEFNHYIGRGVFTYLETLQGTIEGDKVLLEGVGSERPDTAPVRARHVLRRNAVGHLEGLRDNQPIWLVPVSRQIPCPSPSVAPGEPTPVV